MTAGLAPIPCTLVILSTYSSYSLDIPNRSIVVCILYVGVVKFKSEPSIV